MSPVACHASATIRALSRHDADLYPMTPFPQKREELGEGLQRLDQGSQREEPQGQGPRQNAN